MNLRHLTSLALGAVALLAPVAYAADKITIGMAIAQTGGIAPFDVPMLDGFKIAVDEINAAGGIGGKVKIVPIVKDTRSDPAQTTIVAQELIDAGANILISPGDADPSFAMAPLATQHQLPMISTSASSPTLATVGGDYVFLNYPADNYQATVAAQYAANTGYHTAYLLYSPDSQYTTMPLYFGQVFEKLGGKVVAKETYQLNQPNFSPQITKLKALSPPPDVIYTSAYEPDFPSFLRQLRAAGVTIPVLGSDGIDSPTTFGLGTIGEGVVFTTAAYPMPGSEMEAFLAKFEKRYERKSETVYDAVGYDLAKVIEAAVIANGLEVDGPGLQKAIANLENVQDATAKITYKGSRGIPVREGYLIRVKDGKREFVGALMPKADLVPPPQMH